MIDSKMVDESILCGIDRMSANNSLSSLMEYKLINNVCINARELITLLLSEYTINLSKRPDYSSVSNKIDILDSKIEEATNYLEKNKKFNKIINGRYSFLQFLNNLKVALNKLKVNTEKLTTMRVNTNPFELIQISVDEIKLIILKLERYNYEPEPSSNTHSKWEKQQINTKFTTTLPSTFKSKHVPRLSLTNVFIGPPAPAFETHAPAAPILGAPSASTFGTYLTHAPDVPDAPILGAQPSIAAQPESLNENELVIPPGASESSSMEQVDGGRRKYRRQPSKKLKRSKSRRMRHTRNKTHRKRRN
jgi:hypothetical protein